MVIDFEGSEEVLFGGGSFHISDHESHELVEVDVPVASCHFHHIVEFLFRGVHANGLDDCGELFSRDLAIGVLVEEVEGVSVLGHLGLRDVFHFEL